MYYLPGLDSSSCTAKKKMQLLIIRPWRMSYKSLKGYSNIEYDFSMWATRRPNIGLCLLQSNNEQKKRKKIKQFSSSCTCVQEWESRWTYCSSGSIMIITGCPELPFSLLLLLLSSRKNYYFFCFQEIFFFVCFLLKRGSNYYWLYCFHTQTHDNGLLKINAGNCTQLHNDHSFGTSRHQQSTNSLSSFSV